MKDWVTIRKQFAEADPRFGPVPFWWWSGEEVTAERMVWQLEKLRKGGIRNVCIINLAPTGPQYGSVSDQPAFMSEEWWQLFGLLVREAERLGMYVWFYDQIGFSGANLPARIVAEYPEYMGYHLRRLMPDEPVPESFRPLLEHGGYRYGYVRQGFNWLDPKAAATLLDRVHGEFERRFPDKLGKTIAGSFQDELPPLPLWTPEVSRVYKERYGEELTPHIPALFDSLPGCADIRRRVYRIAAELAEQAFFIPLGQWHEKHGMIIGCDQAGSARRADPHAAQRLYLDYFRTHRWFNAPGSDMDGEIKPNASIAHLNGGKRVWLEAFHSSGWGGTLEETLHWMIPFLQDGATLYNPHAIYYSTRGGWWEWAPPDTGWRQPYFEHYEGFADTVSRICSLLAEGAHVCDVAVHYPSHAITGYMSLADVKPNEHPMRAANTDVTEEIAHIRKVYWDLAGFIGRKFPGRPGALRRAGRDYDIVDDTALERAMVDGTKLAIGEERFSVMLLCGTTVMDEASRQRLEQWIAAGGQVIAVAVPESDPPLKGAIHVATTEEAVQLVDKLVPKRVAGPGLSLQRRLDDGTDVFLLLPENGALLPMHKPAEPEYRLPESAVYSIRTAGSPQLWDPVTGQVRPLPHTRRGEWVDLEVPFDSWPAALVVCPNDSADSAEGSGLTRTGSGLPVAAGPQMPSVSVANADNSGSADSGSLTADPVLTLPSDGWTVEPIQTLDNRYGDFDLHDSGERLQVERRQLKVRLETGPGEGEAAGWHLPTLDDADWAERLWSEAVYWTACKGETYDEARAYPIVYSNTFGDLSYRTWAGRMGRIPRRFLTIADAGKGEVYCAKTHVIAPEKGLYWLSIASNGMLEVWVKDRPVSETPAHGLTTWVELDEGANDLTIRATAVKGGSLRAEVVVRRQPDEPLPLWIHSRTPNPASRLIKRIETPENAEVKKVRIIFAAKGRAALCINGTKVTEHGDFNPYLRSGEEEVDVTRWWRPGMNEVALVLPEGVGDVVVDGLVELADGKAISFHSGEEDWVDEQGVRPGAKPGMESETFWIRPRPHPLPHVGWLMPGYEPAEAPLPFVAHPEHLGKPIWFRFPLPAGATGFSLKATGTVAAWVAGQPVNVVNGTATFAPQPAGTVAAIRIVPRGAETEAAVLHGPIRFATVPAPGNLGDWRTELCMPHHTGAVEYTRTFTITGPLDRAVLDLGHVRGTAEVWLDGRRLGVRLWRPYRFVIEDGLQEGEHTLKVRVANTLGTHYEIGRPTVMVGAASGMSVGTLEEQQAWRSSFASSGLYGPVELYGNHAKQ